MLIQLLKSKIHRAEVTASSLHYEGSLGIDQDFMDQVGLLPYERILCGNLQNGERFETYAIALARGSRSISLNGATAHLGNVGDRITIMSFGEVEESEAKKWHPRVIALDKRNSVVVEKKSGLTRQ